MRLLNEISIQIKRIKASGNKYAGVRVEQGKAQYVSEIPQDNGFFVCREISEWMPICDMPSYLSNI